MGSALPDEAAAEGPIAPLGIALSDADACGARPACFAAFSLLANAFSSAGVSSAWDAVLCSALGTGAALPVTLAEVRFTGPWLTVAWLPALCAVFDSSESCRQSAGTAAATSWLSEGCLLMACWQGSI